MSDPHGVRRASRARVPAFASDRRGVSELIGFVLVFSLIVAVVGIVSTAGLSTLQDARDAEQIDNAERAMEVLADNMADIQERGAPSRATEISLEDAQIFLDEPVEIRVYEADGTPALDRTFTVRPIVYDGVDDVRLVYVMDSIFRVQPEGGVVVREWSAITDPKHVSIPIVNTTSATGSSQNIQSSTVLVRANAKRRTIVRADATGAFDDVRIRVETSRNDLWERMLDSSAGFDSCTTGTSPDHVECELTRNPRTFHLVEARIEIAIKK